MAVKKYYVTVDEKGTVRWYKDTKCNILHRENGPAVEYADGTKFWFQNGQKHRTDGPANEWADGTTEWYIDGVYISEDVFLAATQPVDLLANVSKL